MQTGTDRQQHRSDTSRVYQTSLKLTGVLDLSSQYQTVGEARAHESTGLASANADALEHVVR